MLWAVLLVYGSTVLPLFVVGLFFYLVALGLLARRYAVRRGIAVLVSPIVFVPLWIVAPPPLRVDYAYVHYSLLTALLVALATRLPQQSSVDDA